MLRAQIGIHPQFRQLHWRQTTRHHPGPPGIRRGVDPRLGEV